MVNNVNYCTILLHNSGLYSGLQWSYEEQPIWPNNCFCFHRLYVYKTLLPKSWTMKLIFRAKTEFFLLLVCRKWALLLIIQLTAGHFHHPIKVRNSTLEFIYHRLLWLVFSFSCLVWNIFNSVCYKNYSNL